MTYITILVMRLVLVVVFISSLAISPVMAKIGNSREDNFKQYGSEISVEDFTGAGLSGGPFTGFIGYYYSPDWKILAFYKRGKVRSEHLFARDDNSRKVFSREEVKLIADQMFDANLRGSYQKDLIQAKVDGHFFNKGLVAYEKLLDGRKLKGYNGIKVLLYDGDASFAAVNPRALI